jgi:CHAT domain-containing protein
MLEVWKWIFYSALAANAIVVAQVKQQDPKLLPKNAVRTSKDSGHCPAHTVVDIPGKAESDLKGHIGDADLARKTGEPMKLAKAMTEAGKLQWRLGKNEDSLSSFSEAESVYRALPEKRKLADLLVVEGRTKQALARISDALNNYAEARSIYASLLSKVEQGVLEQTNPEQAQVEQTERDSLLQQLGLLANEIGRAHFWRGEYEIALAEYNHALDIWAKLRKQSRAEAFTHQLLARLYTRLGSYESAIKELQTAFAFQKTLCDYAPPRTLADLGVAWLRKGNLQHAARDFQQAEQRQREIDDPEGLAETLSSEASLHLQPGQLHDPDLALRELNEALALQLQAKDKGGETDTRLQIAWALAGQSQWESMLKYLLDTKLADLAHSSFYYSGEAEARYLLGQAYSATGDPVHAAHELRLAVEIQESQHSELNGDSLHAAFSAHARQYYESYIQALEEQAKLGAGDLSATAFEVSEQSRSRALLEHLKTARVDLRHGVSSDLLAQEKSLKRDLSDLYHLIVYAPRLSPQQAEKARTDAATLQSKLETVEAEIRGQVTIKAYAAKLLGLKEIQQLIDKDTLVLEYFLGQRYSYLWGITQDRFVTFELPERAQIEKACSAYYAAAQSVTTDSSVLAQRGVALARLILYPARALMKQKVVIVPDGALAAIPFAALLLPRGDFFIERHQISVLPSLSMLSVLRDHRDAAPPVRTIAIFADPVFSKTDDRLLHLRRAREAQVTSKSGANIASDEYLPRLSASKEEANSIASLVPAEERQQYVGFQADLDNVRSEVLSKFRLVHFSTHAIADNVHPEFSRLVFTLLDSAGKRKRGALLLSDIYNLRLQSDLVTLSSCESGVGKQIDGEGPMSLSRGFLSSGSRAVLTTLWKVDDEATAEFMRRFYQILLQKHRSPVEALQLAQIQLMHHPNQRLRNPYYWAAFELQGDWQ